MTNLELDLFEGVSGSSVRAIAVEGVQKFVFDHPAFSANDALGKEGFSFPEFAKPEVCVLAQGNEPQLAEIGISISGRTKSPSYVVFDRGAKPVKLNVVLSGSGGNLIVIESGSNLAGRLTFEGGGHVALFGRTLPNMPSNVTAVFRSANCGLWFGRDGACNNINCWIDGPEQAVCIGDDHLFSWNIWLRTADGHAIVDLESRKVINRPKSIFIDRHVWLGQDCKVFPGATIGSGSIVGANALVTSAIPPRSVAVGVPARVVRRNASWTRSQHPGEQEIEGLILEQPLF